MDPRTGCPYRWDGVYKEGELKCTDPVSSEQIVF